MRPGDSACYCPECGVTCEGRYPGCPDVWKRGPRTVSTAVVTVDRPKLQMGLGTVTNGKPGAATQPDETRERPGIGRVVPNVRLQRAQPEPVAETKDEEPTAPHPVVEVEPEPAPAEVKAEAAPEPKVEPPKVEAKAQPAPPPVEPPKVEAKAQPAPPPVEPPKVEAKAQPAPPPVAPKPEARREPVLGRSKTPDADRNRGIDALAALEAAAPAEPPPAPPVNGLMREATDHDRWARPTEVPPRGRAPESGEERRPEQDADSRSNGESEPMIGVGLGSPPGAAPVATSRSEPLTSRVLPAAREETSPAPAGADPRTHILKWMERKFDGLREDVRLLAGGTRRQRDTLEEVLERQAELEALIERQAEAADLAREAELAAAEDDAGPSAAVQERESELVQSAHDELARLVNEVVVATQAAGEAAESSIAAQRESSERLRLMQTAMTRELRSLTTAIETLTYTVAGLSVPAPAPSAKTPKTPKATTAKATKATTATRATKATKATKAKKATKPARAAKAAGARTPFRTTR